MRELFSKHTGDLLHIIHRSSEFKAGRMDMVQPFERIQVSSIKMSNGTTFQPHKHILKSNRHDPPYYQTQESWVVIKGRVKAILYDTDNTILEEVILEPGDCSITLQGGHNYEALTDDTLVYEFKTGPYHGQEKDKVFI